MKSRRRMPLRKVAFASFALGLALPWPLAAQTASQTPAPDAPPPVSELLKPAPRTHAQIHAEAHAAALKAGPGKDTPKLRYTRQVEGAIGKLWQQYSAFHRDVVPGRLEISFYVTKKGKVEGLVIQDARQSNVRLTEFTLRAVREAEIPPMPAEVYPELSQADPERLRFDFNFMVMPPGPAEKAKPKAPAKEEDIPKAKTAASPTPRPVPTMPDMAPPGESWQQWLAEQQPLKDYHRQVGALLEAGWKRYLAAHRATLPAGGQVRLSFRVKPDGDVADVLIVDKGAPTRLKNAGLATLQSVRFPPMAPKQAALFAGKPEAQQGVRVPCTFTVAAE